MFSKLYTRSLTGIALMFAMAANLGGVGSASAQTLTSTNTQGSGVSTVRSSPADIHVVLTYSASTPLAPGSAFTYNITVTNDGNGSASNAWVELGLDPNVIVDDFSSDSNDIFVQSLAADNVNIKFGKFGPNSTGTAHVMAHLRSTASSTLTINNRASVTWDDASGKGRSTMSNVLYMAVGQIPIADKAQLQVVGDSTVDAGTILTIQGSAFASAEQVAFWINVPAGMSIVEKSLAQEDTAVQGSVISLDRLGYTDSDGTINYSLDTSGLASGTYSLVGQGWASGLSGTVVFAIK